MKRYVSAVWDGIHLTEHFKLGEFVVSKDHPELAKLIVPTLEQINSLKVLTAFALQPIREEYGSVTITSGLASKELNIARGGVADSQHLYGEAADFICPGVSMLDVYTFCVHDLKWEGELIFYKDRGHVHIALPSLWATPNHFIKEG